MIQQALLMHIMRGLLFVEFFQGVVSLVGSHISPRFFTYNNLKH